MYYGKLQQHRQEKEYWVRMREDAYIQINRWEGCAMYNWDGEKEEFAVQAETQHSSKGSAQRNMFHLANIPAVPHLPYTYN